MDEISKQNEVLKLVALINSKIISIQQALSLLHMNLYEFMDIVKKNHVIINI